MLNPKDPETYHKEINEINNFLMQNNLIGKDECQSEPLKCTDGTSEMDMVRSVVKHWLDLEMRIQEKNAALKALRQEIKSLQETRAYLDTQVMPFMSKNNIPQFNFQNGTKLTLTSTQRKKSVSQKELKEILEKNLKEEDAKKIQSIMEDRPIITKSQLKYKR